MYIGDLMPLDEKDMDKVFELKYEAFLTKMEQGKFYSKVEMLILILGAPHKLQATTLTEAIKDEVANVLNSAYVESVIQAQYAVGNLRVAEKNHVRYYSKV
jgi:hypothetical protein